VVLTTKIIGTDGGAEDKDHRGSGTGRRGIMILRTKSRSQATRAATTGPRETSDKTLRGDGDNRQTSGITTGADWQRNQGYTRSASITTIDMQCTRGSRPASGRMRYTAAAPENTTAGAETEQERRDNLT
jgi:hypothetical protein